MFCWLVPHGYDLGGTVGIIAVNFIVGGVILTWRLLVAVWYIPLTIDCSQIDLDFQLGSKMVGIT